MLIKLETFIKAPINICFDLSRSIDLQKIIAGDSREKVVDGTTSGLISLNECVIWEASYFGIKQRMIFKITEMGYPDHFIDEMIEGNMKILKHVHILKKENSGTLLVDHVEFESKFGIIGKVIDQIIVAKQLKKHLIERNHMIKQYAETEKWKGLINCED